jgi:predicted alpha/beta hydrolase
MPLLTRALGYFPMRRFGMGEDLPAGVALEWARWGRSPEYLGDWSGHAALAAPILSFSFADDPFAPRAAVDALHARYGSRELARRHVAPADVGAARIGHFGFFRPGVAPGLWRETADWLAAH